MIVWLASCFFFWWLLLVVVLLLACLLLSLSLSFSMLILPTSIQMNDTPRAEEEKKKKPWDGKGREGKGREGSVQQMSIKLNSYHYAARHLTNCRQDFVKKSNANAFFFLERTRKEGSVVVVVSTPRTNTE